MNNETASGIHLDLLKTLLLWKQNPILGCYAIAQSAKNNHFVDVNHTRLLFHRNAIRPHFSSNISPIKEKKERHPIMTQNIGHPVNP